MPPPTPGSTDARPPGRLESLRHPLAVTAFSALLAGWLIPGFAHQWQDRQKERELKRGLATQLDRDATTAVVAGRILIDRRFPEAQTTEARRLEHASDSVVAAAREHERDAAARTFIGTFSAWL